MKAQTFIFWGKISFFFLLRSGKSTAFLSIMVVTAVSTLIFLSSLAVGVNDAMLRNSVGLFSGHITAQAVPFSLKPDNLTINGVKGVLQRIYIPGIVSRGTQLRSVTLCTIDSSRERSLTALHRKIEEGAYPQSGRDEIVLSRIAADELSAEIGSEILFRSQGGSYSRQLTVSGIYRTGLEKLDGSIAFSSLDVGLKQTATWSATIFLQDGYSTEETNALFQKKWPEITFESWRTTMPDLLQLIELEYISMGIVIVLVFAVVAIGIACSFIIFIIKNIREYGIMKSMGVTNGEISFLILCKVALMNILSCSTGTFLGIAIVWCVRLAGGIDISAFTSHNQYFTVSGIIFPRLTFFSLIAPPVTAIIFSVLAGLWPAILVARQKTSDIIRSI